MPIALTIALSLLDAAPAILKTVNGLSRLTEGADIVKQMVKEGRDPTPEERKTLNDLMREVGRPIDEFEEET